MEKLSDKIKMLLENTGEVAFDIKSMGVTEPEVEIETIKESEDVRLSGEAVKTLSLMAIAEKLINESVDETNSELIEAGFLVEGKLTLTAKQWLSRYLPTIFAS